MTGFSALQAPRKRLRILRRAKESIRPASPRPQRRDCQGRLAAALLALAGDDATLEEAGFRPWCSATFIGAQHRMTLRITGPKALTNAERLAKGLPDADLLVPGHIVADVTMDAITTVAGDAVLVDLAVLTIEDW